MVSICSRISVLSSSYENTPVPVGAQGLALFLEIPFCAVLITPSVHFTSYFQEQSIKSPRTDSSFCGNLPRPLACPAAQNEILKGAILHHVKKIHSEGAFKVKVSSKLSGNQLGIRLGEMNKRNRTFTQNQNYYKVPGVHSHALVALIFFPQGMILDAKIAFRPMKTRFEYLYQKNLLINSSSSSSPQRLFLHNFPSKTRL